MALTEIQQVTKVEFFQKIQSEANRINTFLLRVKNLTDFLANVDATELGRMNVTAEDQTKMARLRSRLNDLNTLAEGDAVSTSPVGQDLNTVVDSIRSM